uniref:Uncharacterized protein n=1 Tax=Romanomermis culicivorax TaxID=13658 RepID=A0A915J439_ROMCU
MVYERTTNNKDAIFLIKNQNILKEIYSMQSNLFLIIVFATVVTAFEFRDRKDWMTRNMSGYVNESLARLADECDKYLEPCKKELFLLRLIVPCMND